MTMAPALFSQSVIYSFLSLSLFARVSLSHFHFLLVYFLFREIDCGVGSFELIALYDQLFRFAASTDENLHLLAANTA